MSEYQYLAFRAVDRCLTERELAFARKQSTRAEICLSRRRVTARTIEPKTRNFFLPWELRFKGTFYDSSNTV